MTRSPTLPSTPPMRMTCPVSEKTCSIYVECGDLWGRYFFSKINFPNCFFFCDGKELYLTRTCPISDTVCAFSRCRSNRKKKMVCARNSIYGKPTKYKNKISFVNPLDGWINGSLFKRRKKSPPTVLG